MNNGFIMYIKGCGCFSQRNPYCKMFVDDMYFSICVTHSSYSVFSSNGWCFWSYIFDISNVRGFDYSNYASCQFNRGKVR